MQLLSIDEKNGQIFNEVTHKIFCVELYIFCQKLVFFTRF